MGLKPIWRLLVEFLWFQMQRLFFVAIENVALYLNGTYTEIRASKAPKNYSKSARICSVRKWIIFDPWSAYNTRVNLISWHQGFVHPEYVLRDEVSVYCLTDDEAWFVEAPEGVEVWKSKYSAFHKIAQHEHAKNVIKMPLQSYYRLAEQLGDIQQKLIFLDFVPRSGSTLVGQIFEETGVCVNYSEPHFLNMYWGTQDHGKMNKMVKAAIQFYCKPRKESTSAFIFKSAPMGKSLVPLIHKLFPDAKFLHLTRNAIPNVKSLFMVMQAAPVARIFSLLKSIPFLNTFVVNNFLESLNLPADNFIKELCVKSVDATGLSEMYMYAFVHRLFVDHHNKASYKVAVIKYEDLLTNREDNIRIIFRFCDLDLKLVTMATQAFEKDSQAGSPLSKDQLKHIVHPKLFTKEAQLKDVRSIGEHFGFGDLTKDFRIPGTITSI